jgi:predicted type IV restriction endonuclease
MNEAETRAEHIDPALKDAGWGVVEGSKVLREYPIAPGRIEGRGRRGKAIFADYVLVYRNRKLAVIEAKAWLQIDRHFFISRNDKQLVFNRLRSSVLVSRDGDQRKCLFE